MAGEAEKLSLSRQRKWQLVWQAVDKLKLHEMLYVEGEGARLRNTAQARRQRGLLDFNIATLVRGDTVYFIRTKEVYVPPR